MNTIHILAAMFVWGIVHSIMASPNFKEFLRDRFGVGFMRLYRLLYNVFSILSFLPILYLVASPDQALYVVAKPLSYLMMAGQIFALACLIITFLQTDSLSFVGIKQLFVEDTQSHLVTRGFYRLVRHPLYTFSLLALWLSPAMTLNTFVFYVGATLYFIVGAYFEERKLLREFGDEYSNYKHRTPMLIPWTILRK